MSSAATPVHGNYHGYYTKRPFVPDPRLSVIPASLFKNARVLDVGCNEGWVTCEIAQSRGVKKAVGVDIDDSLVRAAWKRRRYVWSLQDPVLEPSTSDSAAVIARAKKRKYDDSIEDVRPRRPQADYFPASCEHMFGSLPVPPASHGPGTEHEMFPHNVTFRTADWVNQEIPEDAEGYDVVLALSLSKWIHLNGGDEGITHFFRRVYDVLRPGGRFVLEPQEWDTYAKAKRMDARLKETAQSLKLRPENFATVLRSIGFGAAEHLGKIGEGGFRRPIDVYTKNT